MGGPAAGAQAQHAHAAAPASMVADPPAAASSSGSAASTSYAPAVVASARAPELAPAADPEPKLRPPPELDEEDEEPGGCLARCTARIQRADARVAAYNERARARRRARRAHAASDEEDSAAEDGESPGHGSGAGAGLSAGTGKRERISAHGAQAKEGESPARRYALVPLVVVVLVWVYLVFTWRLCTPMIQRRPTALNSRSVGIGLLVAFNVLWLMTAWAYVRVLLAQPGFARDQVPQCDPPAPYDGPLLGPPLAADGAPLPLGAGQAQQHGHQQQQVAGYQTNQLPEPLSDSIPIEQSALADGPSASGSAGGEHETAASQPDQAAAMQVSARDEEKAADAGLAAAIGPLGAAAVSGGKEAAAAEKHALALQEAAHQGEAHAPPAAGAPPIPQLLPEPQRLPPSAPPLHPSQRYCHKCRLVKPPRTHHCRKCGTCVLKMDHHCPWVVGCVGARNHKFFHHFLLWVTALEAFTLVSVAVNFARGVRRRAAYAAGGSDAGAGWPLDGYLLSLFPIVGWFLLFTGLLLGLHTYLFVCNQTTIEQLDKQRRQSREAVLLSMYFSPRGAGGAELARRRADREGNPALWKAREARRIKRGWTQQWGDLTSTGNMWWLGGKGERAMAEQPGAVSLEEARRLGTAGRGAWLTNLQEIFGRNPLHWFLPIGHSPRDGLWYPLNPRFRDDGAWQPRSQWAEVLR